MEDQEVLLVPERGAESPRLRISLKLLDPAGGTAAGDQALGALLQTALYGGTGVRDYALALENAEVEAYRGEAAGEDRGMAMNWEYAETVAPLLPPFEQVLVIERNREYFRGGAHGMREKQFFVIDREQGKLLQLDDLLMPGARPLLRELIAGALRQKAALPPGTPLREGGFFEDAPELPENFSLSAEGLTFHWNPYEIAPYAAGPLEVQIPAGELPYLLVPAYTPGPPAQRGS